MFNDAVHVNYIYQPVKPKPAGYRKAMEVLGTDPSNTIFVGDQIFTDILGANKSKLFSILVKYIRADGETKIGKKRQLERIILWFYQKNR